MEKVERDDSSNIGKLRVQVKTYESNVLVGRCPIKNFFVVRKALGLKNPRGAEFFAYLDVLGFNVQIERRVFEIEVPAFFFRFVNFEIGLSNLWKFRKKSLINRNLTQFANQRIARSFVFVMLISGRIKGSIDVGTKFDAAGYFFVGKLILGHVLPLMVSKQEESSIR